MSHTKMRVGVNLLWLVHDVVGGTEEYTIRLLTGVAERAPQDIELVLFTPRTFARTYPALAEHFETVAAPGDGARKPARIALEWSWLAVQARRAGLDLLHHAGGTIPAIRLTPPLVTIHDLQPLQLPANFDPVKQAYLRWRVPASAKASRLVITLTEHARRSVVERLGIDASRVVVVPPGFTLALNEVAQSDPATAYRIDGPFFLFPAITYPHKNHLMLVRAFAKAVAEHPGALLVLTSGPAQMEGAIGEEVARLGIGDSVRRLGRIPRGDLDWLVRHATALTFPSRFEGFGLPVLEAMGNGCPVIAADATALPEVVGDGGILVDPDDVDGWSAAMLQLLSDADLRSTLIGAGLAESMRYQWTASTDALLDAYERAGRSERGTR
jgi:alpha-1,3-rhamnosyl/mannosyltransferase